MKPHLHDGKYGAAITVRVIPRSPRNEIVEVMPDGVLKVRLKAPPVEGKANLELIRFMADKLDIPPSKFEIVAGTKGKVKILTILDIESADLEKRLIKILEG
jgi:uncharacterized protein